MLQYKDRYAVTINPSPNKLINKKRWKLYDHSSQERILLRIVQKLSEKNPSIVCIEKHFEMCPTLGQIHLHALYSFPIEYMSTLENWIEHSLAWKDDKSIPPWRHLDIQPINNQQGWLEYIRKDIKPF